MGIEFEVKASVDPKGISRNLRALSPAIDDELDALTKTKAYAIRDEAKAYEAAPTALSQRTGRMSRETTAYRAAPASWKAEMRAPYSKYVRGTMTQGQAWMHKGRWTSWRDIVKRQLDNVKRDMLQAIKRARERVGL